MRLLPGLLILISITSFAQHYDTTAHDYQQAKSLKEWFRNGHTSGLLRLSAMSTFNDDELTDHAALGAGGRLYYHTAIFHGFQLGVGGLYIYNLASTDLSQKDPSTAELSRWERQLFDITDPENKKDLDRLEELFVKYRYHNLNVTFGKQPINTPLVNEQDTRMKPTAMHGAWFDYKNKKYIHLYFGWFDKASPRSTTEWYTLSEAIGIYNQGQNIDGSSSAYRNNINTEGLIVFGLVTEKSKYKIKFWQYSLLNIMNTVFWEGEMQKNNFLFGLQFINQFQLKNGGSEHPLQKYYSDKSVNLFSGRVQYRTNRWKISLNSSTALGQGRFTFPRELGTADLYTYISRHRIEGLGRFNTHTFKLNFYPDKYHKNLDIGLYFAYTSTSSKPKYNKYNFISYGQLNLDIKQQLSNNLDGLELRLLLVVDRSGDRLTQDPTLVFNKTNLVHLNLIANYSF